MGDAQTPSERIIAEANATQTVTDKRGRLIEMRRLRGRTMARFTRACGAAADIQNYFQEAIIRAAVVSIAGQPMPPTPVNLDQIDALWDRVDDDAFQAVIAWFVAIGEAKELSGENPT